MKLSTLSTCFVLLAFGCVARAQDSAKERVAALKANIETSKIILRQYQWIQTTTVSMNGDVKSTKVERCYYGADGSLQKVEISDEQAPQRQGLLFRRIKEQKKEEMTDYMKSAVALVKSYVPPSSSLIQNCKDNGNVSLQPLSGGRARIVLKNYIKPGDTYAIELNLHDNRPLGLRVSTYVNDPSDVVSMNAEMGRLDNGTTYTSLITLNAESKGMTVTVKNSGYQRTN